MDPEMNALIQIWLTATVSMIFCHQVAARMPSGAARLLCILPIVYLLTTLPYRLSSLYLGCLITFYGLAWLTSFRLLLFAFDQGPLSTAPLPPLLHFIPIALLPIKTRDKTSPQSLSIDYICRPLPYFLLKVGLVAAIFSLYEHNVFTQPYIIMCLTPLQFYLGLELLFAAAAAPVRLLLGLDIERTFNEPFLATSLQDFWGRRWNLVMSSIIREAIYLPIRRILTRILGRRWSASPSIFVAFVISGLLHEILYNYLTHTGPTWEVTWFFVLHGFLVAVEVELKKAASGRWQLHWVVSTLLTLGIILVTTDWLLFPHLARNKVDEKAFNEYSILVRLLFDRIRMIS